MAVCTAEVIFGWIEEIFGFHSLYVWFCLFVDTWIEERICAIRASWEAAELLLVDDKPLGWKECSNLLC